MEVEQILIDNVEAKLNKQNALLAAFGGAFWIIPTLMVWSFVFLYNPNFGAVMLLLSGAVIGLAVRIHGKGFSFLFSALSFFTHLITVLIAFSLELVVGGTIGAVFLFGLYAGGAAMAMYISRIDVPFDEHRAYFQLTRIEPSKSIKKIKNRWFIAIPFLGFIIILSSNVAVIGVTFLVEYQFESEFQQKEQQQRKLEQNRHIDVTPKGLEDYTTQQALLYAYAYQTGILFNKRGKYTKSFPRSEFKAQTVLQYLVNTRDDARAKFILGTLIGSSKGQSLIQEALEQGDQYAKLHSTIEYGCYSDADLAMNLLNGQYKLARDEALKEEIASVIYIGFKEVCSDLEDPQFTLSYVLNYTGKK